MKGWIVGLFLCVCTGLLPLSAQSTAKQEAKRALAVRSAAEWVQEQQELLRTDPEGILSGKLEGIMQQTMLADPGAHAEAGASRKRTEALLREVLQQELRRLEAEGRKRAEAHSPLPVEAETWTRQVGLPDTERDSWMGQTLETPLREAYPRARAAAVDRQVRDLLEQTRPPDQATVDAWLSSVSDENPDSLLPRNKILGLQARLQQAQGVDQKPLLREARLQLDQQAEAFLHKLADQAAFQQQALKHAAAAPGAGAPVLAEAIRPALLAAVQEALAEDTTGLKPGETRYDVFLPVQEDASRFADRLERRALMEALEQGGWSVPDVRAVDAELRRDPRRHADPEKSLRQLADHFREPAQQAVLSGILARAEGLSAPEHDRLREELARHLTEFPEAGKRFDEQLHALLAERTEPLRETLSREQVAPLMERLETITPLPVREVDRLYAERELRAYAELQDLRAEDLLAPALSTSDRWLQEAEHLALKQTNVLLADAEAAHRAQAELLRRLEQDNLEALKQEVEDGVSLGKIRRKWEKDFASRWQSHPTADSYPGLFAANRRTLEKILRQWYDRLVEASARPSVSGEGSADSEQDIPVEETPADQQEVVIQEPEDTTRNADAQESAGSEGSSLDPEELDFARKAPVALRVTDVDGDAIELRVYYGELERHRRVRIPSGSGEEDMAALIEGLDPGLWAEAFARHSPKRGWLGTQSKATPVPVLVWVESRNVRYRTMIRMRETLSRALDARALEQGLVLPPMEWTAISDGTEP